MPSDEQREALRKALTSIYFHGRREEIENVSVTVSRHMMSLEQAIEVLAEAKGDDVVGHVRLALADLVRTRAGSQDPRLDRHIRQLTKKLAELHDKAETHINTFTEIFEREDESPLHPDDAYLKAMGHMQRIHHEHHERSGERLVKSRIDFSTARHESIRGKEPPFAMDDETPAEEKKPKRKPRPTSGGKSPRPPSRKRKKS
jgi:hypothetical protein